MTARGIGEEIVSWFLQRRDLRFLLNRAVILAPDILAGEFDINHCCMNVGVAHQVHQSRQRKAGAHHVGPEGMTKAVSIGPRNVTAMAMMAKQGTEAKGCLSRHR